MKIEISNLDSEEFRAAINQALVTSLCGEFVLSCFKSEITEYKIREIVGGILRRHLEDRIRVLLAEDEACKTKMKEIAEQAIELLLTEDLATRIRLADY